MENLLFLGVPILKHIRVISWSSGLLRRLSTGQLSLQCDLNHAGARFNVASDLGLHSKSLFFETDKTTDY